jgi:hypothetical protein
MESELTGLQWAHHRDTCNQWFLGILKEENLSGILGSVYRRPDGSWDWNTRYGDIGNEPTRYAAMTAVEARIIRHPPGHPEPRGPFPGPRW